MWDIAIYDVHDGCIDIEKSIFHHCTIVHNPEDENNSENLTNRIQPPHSAERNRKFLDKLL
jgi:hypothetical protein